ncbi:MAG: nucleoside deaminase [Clostridiales bacterium]|nr:nucleoside deaminase [Clostridiales bacterium]
MLEALSLAKQAYALGEVPVGAVVVKDGNIISRAFNMRETNKNALLHAETEAVYKACEALKSWRLCGCDLYVTLEPCAMCAGAIINARISNVYFGAYDKTAGCCGSVVNLFEIKGNYRPKYFGGLLEDDCSHLLTEFFANKRNEIFNTKTGVLDL